jgi:predicted AlkP superfamily pyrophosphatase or phosphodiesterase
LLLIGAGPPEPRRVVVIGYDGLSPAGLRMAKAQIIDRLRSEGASTMHARGVLPTVSSPNWASMIMGAGPAAHGVTSNDWEPANATIVPACQGISGRFPTIFGLLREQRPSESIAIFHEWKGFARLVEPGVPSPIERGDSATETIRRAITYLETNRPRLLFIHLDSVDHAGHEEGHLTPAYVAAIEAADQLTGSLVEALERKGLRKDTVFLLTADHGGVGKKHGGESMAELEIPWILSGAGVKRGVELQSPVSTVDTAATIAHILGLKTPACWTGRPVIEALDGTR